MDDLETTPCEHYWRSLRQEDRLGRYPVIAYEPFTDKNGRQYNRRRVSFVEKIVAFDIFYCQKCLLLRAVRSSTAHED